MAERAFGTLPVPRIKDTGKLDLRSPLEVIRSGERIVREESIPVGGVLLDGTLIDKAHSKYLARLMLSDDGQIHRINVRPRELDGKVVFDTTDGYHRADAIRINGWQTALATCLYGRTNAEVARLRIIAAPSVSSVKFGRVATWMNDAYAESEWKNSGVSLLEAFSVTNFNSKTTKSPNVQGEKVEELKVWCKDFADAIQMTVGEVWVDLSIAVAADPELVLIVREDSKDRDKTMSITASMLQAVTDVYPGPDNYGIQKGLINFALQNQLTTRGMRELIEKSSRQYSERNERQRHCKNTF